LMQSIQQTNTELEEVCVSLFLSQCFVVGSPNSAPVCVVFVSFISQQV
jgi:hypothetical protein